MLKKIRQETDSVLVAFSTGKDSLCCLDLCTQIFPEVRGYFLYTIPGLRMFAGKLEYARARWDVEILEREHPQRAYLRRAGIYRPPSARDRSLRASSWSGVEDDIRREIGSPALWIVRGWKMADGITRRITLTTYEDDSICRATHRIYPISHWCANEVARYMRLRQIPVPDSFGARTFDVELTPATLRAIRDAYPDDYSRILAEYPQAEAAIMRDEYYDIRSQYDEKKT